MAAYGRSYGSVEETLRRARIFAANLAHINSVNSNPANTWKASVNKLTDRTNEEIAMLKVIATVAISPILEYLICAPGLPSWYVPFPSLIP
jgi:flagellar basal body rod protein FlgC